MYLFNRRVRLAGGNLLDSIDWAARITEKVNALSPTPVALWTPRFSASARTLSWTTVVEDLAQIEDLDAKTMADEGYVTLVDEGAAYASADPVDDTLGRLLVADAEGADGAFSRVVTANLQPGRLSEGVELGIEIAARAKALTGASSSFALSETGGYGSVAFFALYPTVEALQKGNEALSGDEGFRRFIDERGADVFVPLSGEITMWRRAS